jgi:hypothetical protein
MRKRKSKTRKPRKQTDVFDAVGLGMYGPGVIWPKAPRRKKSNR